MYERLALSFGLNYRTISGGFSRLLMTSKFVAIVLHNPAIVPRWSKITRELVVKVSAKINFLFSLINLSSTIIIYVLNADDINIYFPYISLLTDSE